MGYIIKNAMVVTEKGVHKLDVRIRGQLIAEIGQIFDTGDDTIIDASNCTIFPGFIDPHTHFDLAVGGTITADDFPSGTRAAIFGGTTTIIDFATQQKGGTLLNALDEWNAKAEKGCFCDYAFHMAITDFNNYVSKEMDFLKRQGINSYKIYLAYEDLKMSTKMNYKFLKRAKELDLLVGIHCENGDLVDAIAEDLIDLGFTEPKYHPISRPDYVEAEAVLHAMSLADKTGAKIMIVHLSSEKALNILNKRPCNIFIETCPQYLLLDDTLYDARGFEGGKYILSPPLRKPFDNAMLWQALTRGEIDTIATDHCSFNFFGQKTIGRENFRLIPNGIPGVEHRGLLMYSEGVKKERITLEQFSAVMSTNAAKLYGLYPKKGIIAVGSDADLTIISDNPSKIAAKTQHHNVDYTPYEGKELSCSIETVFLRGQIAVHKGKDYGVKGMRATEGR